MEIESNWDNSDELEVDSATNKFLVYIILLSFSYIICMVSLNGQDELKMN